MGKHDVTLRIREKGAAKTSRSISGVTKAVVGLVSAYGAYRAIGLAKDIVVSINNAYERQNAILKRMNSTLKLVPGYTKASQKQFVNLASALQRVGVLGDDVTEAFVSQMASFKLSTDNIKKLLPAAQDYIVATYGIAAGQEHAIQAANALGKAFMGQAGMLARTGIIMTDAQKQILKTGTQAEQTAALVSVLNDNYKGMNRTMRTSIKGISQAIKNAYGDLKELIGGSFYKNSELEKVLRDLEAFFSSDSAQRWAERLGGAVGSAAKLAQDYLRRIGLLPGADYTQRIGAARAGLVDISNKSAMNKARRAELQKQIESQGGIVSRKQRAELQSLTRSDRGLERARQMVEKELKSADKTGAPKSIGEVLKNLFVDVKNLVTSIFKAMWQQVVDLFAKLFKELKDAIQSGFEAVVDAIRNYSFFGSGGDLPGVKGGKKGKRNTVTRSSAVSLESIGYSASDLQGITGGSKRKMDMIDYNATMSGKSLDKTNDTLDKVERKAAEAEGKTIALLNVFADRINELTAITNELRAQA